MGRNAQQCAWQGCSKTTDKPSSFVRRRPVDPALQSPLLKPAPHSSVLCNAHGLAWQEHASQASAAADSLDALLSAAAADASSSSTSSSQPAAVSLSHCLNATVATQAQPLQPAPPLPSASTAVTHRHALSVLNLNTLNNRDNRRHSTPLKTKRQVVRAFSDAQTAAERKAVSMRFCVTAHDVRRYAATIAKNEQLPPAQHRPLTARRLAGAGRKRALTEQQEQALDDWVMDKRRCEARLAVSELDIRMEARTRYNILASNKWVQGFMQRRRLSLRLATTNKELSTVAMRTVLFHWRNKFAELFRSTPGDLLYNMDETSVYLDAPAARTVERIAARCVEIGTTKHELDRVAVVLCVSRAGAMVTALLIFKCYEKTLTEEEEAALTAEQRAKRKTNRLDRVCVKTSGGDVNLVVTHNRKAWLTGKLMVQWLTQIYKPAVEQAGATAAADALLFMDNCSVHEAQQSMTAMREAAIRHEFLPPNCTPILQPCDQNINQLFKKVYSQQWTDWYKEKGRFARTKHGNPKKASKTVVTSWVAHAVNAITPTIIRASWERSAVVKYGLMHLPDGLWEIVLSYCDRRAGWLPLLSRTRVLYGAWRAFDFPRTKKGKQLAAAAAAAAAAASQASSPPMQVQLHTVEDACEPAAMSLPSAVQPALRRLHPVFLPRC
jgi:hypothetical protein